MYAPEPYLSSDTDIAINLIESIVMGTLIAADPLLHGSPLPFMARKNEAGNLTLISHMDKRNPLWQSLLSNPNVLVVFWGPNSYISPSIYNTSPRVPTWVYASVHINGKASLVHDEDKLNKIVTDLSQFMEKPDSGWDISQVGNYKHKLLPAIVGFEIDVTICQSQLRLGQVNSAQDRQAVYLALSNGNHANRQVAELMEKLSIVETGDFRS